MAVVTNHRSDRSSRHDHGEVAGPELHGCGNRTVTRTAKVYWWRRASVSNPISGELAHPADYRLIGYSGRHWRRFLCTRADPFWEPLLWHPFLPRFVGRTRARTQRTRWLRDGTHVHALLAFCPPCRRELFRPTPPRQPSRHASSAASCEGRAERGWLPLRACRERSGRRTATRLALPPSQHAPSNIFPSPISCARQRTATCWQSPSAQDWVRPRAGHPLLCVPEGVCGVAAVVQRAHARSLVVVGVRSGVLLLRSGASALVDGSVRPVQPPTSATRLSVVRALSLRAHFSRWP